MANRDPIELDFSSLPTMSGTSLWDSVRSLRGLIVGGAGAIVVCWIVVAAWILQLRDLARETAARELVSLSVLLADNTDRTLQGVDLLLTLLAGRLEIALSMPSGRDPGHLHDILRNGLAGIPQVDRALVIGSDGMAIGDSEFPTPRRVSVADRPHFQIHLQNSDTGLFISDPVRSRIDETWSIVLTRRLSTPEGDLAGVIAAIVRPAYFAKLFEVTGRSRTAHTTLLKKGGIVLATTSLTGAPVIGEVVRVDPAYVIGKQGVLAGRSPVTGISRLAGYADAQTYPITIVSSRDATAIAETTSRSETMIVVAGLLVSALIITLIWVLSREMRSLQARFRDGIERMSDGFMLWDRDERLIAWNSRYEELIPEMAVVLRRGATFEALLRKAIRLCRPAMSAAQLDAHVGERLARFRKPGEAWEQALGGDRVIEIQESRTASGGIVSIFRDMTERKRHAETLEHALVVQREANEIHRRFIAMASHEFRTPLAVIDGAAQRVLARTGETPEIRNRMGRIRDSVLRMTDVIDRMLSSARLEEGRITMEPGRVDLSTLVREVCERQRQISLDFEIDIAMPDEPVVISGDSRLLDQVVTNLLSNAIKYSGQSRRIEVLCERRDVAGAEAVVSVHDFGVGVPADEIDKLFTRFFRARTASGIPGTGIGLHLTRELVRLHGGRLDVASQVGVGSTFTVILPGCAAIEGAAAA